MLRDKGNMRHGKLHGLSGGPFVRQGGGGWVEGLVDFRKNIYIHKTDIFLNHTSHCRIKSTAPLCTVSAAPVNYASDNSCLYLTAVFVTKYDKANTVH